MYVTATIIQEKDSNMMACSLWSDKKELSSVLDDESSIIIHPKLPYLVADDVYVDQTKNSIRLVAGWHVDFEEVWIVVQKHQDSIHDISIEVFDSPKKVQDRLDQARKYILDAGLTYTEEYGQFEYISEENQGIWFIDKLHAEDNRMVPI